MTSLEEEGITRTEFEQISELLKNEDFRKLFFDYCEEINDPENKKLYEKELIEFEKERGIDVTFINPEPGFVIKTSENGDKKCFINIAQCCKVEKPSYDIHKNGKNWKIPFTQAPPHRDYDKKKNKCVVYDVVFHPDTLKMSEADKRFRELVINSALDGVQNSFNVNIDRNNLKYPKMKYKGMIRPTIIRKKSDTPPKFDNDPLSHLCPPLPSEKVESTKVQETKKIESNEYTIPKYNIIQRYDVDIQECVEDRNSKINSTIPKDLIITIDLPLLRTTEDVNLDVTTKELFLISEKPSKYKLKIKLPYSVDENLGKAKFDKIKKKLEIILPVKREIPKFYRKNLIFEQPTTTDETTTTTDEIEPIKLIQEIIPTEIPFLDPKISYKLPEFNILKLDQFQLLIKHENIDRSSIEFNEKLENGFQLKFYILGPGYFPIYYSIFIKFFDPIKLIVNEQLFDDNNFILKFKMNNEFNLIENIFVGINDDDCDLKEILI